MDNMTWVQKTIKIDASEVNNETEARPAKISDKLTPKYLEDGDLDLFRKLPQEQETARYEGRFSS